MNNYRKIPKKRSVMYNLKVFQHVHLVLRLIPKKQWYGQLNYRWEKNKLYSIKFTYHFNNVQFSYTYQETNQKNPLV